MSKVNIPKTTEDSFYRYKRDKMKITEEKHFICLDNLTSITEIELKRDIKETTQWFQQKLGTPIIAKKGILKVKLKSLDVGGTNKISKEVYLDNLLEEYIDEYVMCKKCGLPDTCYNLLSIIPQLKCQACGDKRDLNDDSICKIINKSKPNKKDKKKNNILA